VKLVANPAKLNGVENPMEVHWDNTDPTTVVLVDNMDQDERLALAEALLTTIKANLNIAVTTCSSCGTDYKEDWDEYVASQALDGAITRIKKAKHLLIVSAEKRQLEEGAYYEHEHKNEEEEASL
jgi:Fe-S oxidoreductase